jgi:hypothetical protein
VIDDGYDLFLTITLYLFLLARERPKLAQFVKDVE